jgi:hypothetical protein
MRRPGWNTYSLKEHQDALRTVDNERRREVAAALVLAAFAVWREVQRRLDTLNHAHEQAVDVQHTYVRDEKFEDFVDRYEENRETVAKALTLAEGKSSRHLDVRTVFFSVAALLIAVAAILSQHIH